MSGEVENTIEHEDSVKNCIEFFDDYGKINIYPDPWAPKTPVEPWIVSPTSTQPFTITSFTYPDQDLVYFAGFIDADGSVSISSKGKGRQHQPRLTGTNKVRLVLDQLKAKFGGSVYERKDEDCFCWDVSGNKAIEAAKQLEPYLRIKREQAQLIANWAINRGYPEIQEAIRKEIRRLNGTD